ncbi:ParB family chromosome partitioning protein [Loktanella ponticola]|uniref:ParB family chromosome partitioning protein n=1 Tax=Yoonia ponticola TaxID=1524255 RepID=A0A7W9BIR9_9RHOB|nr:ParB/RepB/Spo0J family partition protein [Yoonia ponticola]MBB5721318.1 ParB family chromosome partitioning protein [Yoonia ponticola]
MSEKRNKNRGLGRGLSALMADVGPEQSTAPRRAETHIPVERVHPNPDQPRRAFNQDALAELAASIKEKGIIQPLIVRPLANKPDNFEIVAGERRWRAAQIAQLHEVPVIVRSFDDTEVLEIAIIENIQRADLNPVDEAAGYRQLMDKFGHTQEQMSQALGKSRSHIANLLRLLNLPDDVQRMLTDGQISAGHARALVGHPFASALARQIVEGGLSVRDAERLAKQETNKAASTPKAKKPSGSKDADTVQIEAELAATLGMKVSIDHSNDGEGGKMVLNYRSLDQLDDLLRALGG